MLCAATIQGPFPQMYVNRKSSTQCLRDMQHSASLWQQQLAAALITRCASLEVSAVSASPRQPFWLFEVLACAGLALFSHLLQV